MAAMPHAGRHSPRWPRSARKAVRPHGCWCADRLTRRIDTRLTSYPKTMMTMHTVELEACTVTFLGEDVVHTHFKDNHLVTPEEVQLMFDAIEAERKGRKVLLLVSV